MTSPRPVLPAPANASHPESRVATPRLAQAFLALGDDGVVTDRTRAPATVLASLAATLVLALSAPVAWAAAGHAPKLSDQPSATAASKASVPAPDDDGGDGGA